MQRLLLFCIGFSLCVIPSSYGATSTGTSGCVELDDISFDKIINKFDAALVKFDVAFPYGDKHDAFQSLAKESKDVDELLIAQVGVKDYGEKDNEALAVKYGATKDNFPVVKLFAKGKSEPITFDASNGFTADELRKFVTAKTDIHLTLPGCVKEMDQIAIKFVKTTGKDQRQKLLKEAEKVAKGLPEKHAKSTKVYLLVMQRILEKGDEFIKNEYQRVSKLLGSKLSDEKMKELVNRIHILHTFRQNSSEKEEL